MSDVPVQFFRPELFVPEIAELFKDKELGNVSTLRVPVCAEGSENEPRAVLLGDERTDIVISHGDEIRTWSIKSLRGLFRGNKKPGPIREHSNSDYQVEFIIIELHVLDYCLAFGPARDVEFEEVYSALRRRPDGRSLNPLHDYLWQVAALVLGTRPLSEAEFQAIMSRLEQSCRIFGMGPTSRNYAASIWSTLGRAIRG